MGVTAELKLGEGQRVVFVLRARLRLRRGFFGAGKAWLTSRASGRLHAGRGDDGALRRIGEQLELGVSRNLDYRYTWIRDAAFTLYGLLRIGLTEEAAQFMDWIETRCRELAPGGSLQIMYGIDGTHILEEETLDHLEGYRCSRPVRIGNAAYTQLQLDT
jgi:Glycosyl hydrolases family 15